MYKIRPVITHDELNVQPTHNMYKVRPVNGWIDKTPLVSLQKIISGRVEQLLKVFILRVLFAVLEINCL